MDGLQGDAMRIDESVLLSDAFGSIVHELGRGSRTRDELSHIAGCGMDAAIEELIREGVLMEEGGSVRPTALTQNLDRICSEARDSDDRTDRIEAYLSWRGIRDDSVMPPFDPDELSILAMFALSGAEEMTRAELEGGCDRRGIVLDGVPTHSGVFEASGDEVRLTPRGRELALSLRSVLAAMFDDRAPVPEHRSQKWLEAV